MLKTCSERLKLLQTPKVQKVAEHNRNRPIGEGKDYHPYSSSVPRPFRLFFYLLIQSTPDNSNSEKVRVIESSKQITGNKEIRKWISLRNIRFSWLFAAGDVSRVGNVPSGEEPGETDVFAG